MSIKIENPKIRQIYSLENFPLGKVVHIYGAAGSGKSTFCLQTAYLLAKKGFKTLYIDTAGTYSVKRLNQMSGSAFDEISSLVLFSNPRSFNDQNKLINSLSNFITLDVRLIVIDCIVSFYRSELSKKKLKGVKLNKMLNQQVAQLKSIALNENILVLIVNQVRAEMNSPGVLTSPLSKKIFDYWSDLEIQFMMLPEEKMIRLSILREQVGEIKKEIKSKFKIIQEGFV